MKITRYVNNTNPSKLPKYNYYADALNASSDGDVIEVYNNNDTIIFSFTFRKPINLQANNKDLTDDLTKFLFTFINSSNPEINQVKAGKKLYLDYNSNKFRLGNINNTNRAILGENEFAGSKFNLVSDLPSNLNLLVGVGDDLKFDNKDLDNGFFIKQINSTNFNSTDTPDLSNPLPQNISVVKINENTNMNATISIPVGKSDLTKEEFANKMFLYKPNNQFDKVNLIKSNQQSYSIVKNNEKTFTVEIPSDGIIMFLDPGRYQEYAINQISHNTDNNISSSSIVNRAGIKLYNLGQAPKKGIFNGWRLNKTIENFISYNIYDKNFDYDISNKSVEYFWICIFQPENQAQTLKLDISGTQYIAVTQNYSGKYVFWFSLTGNDITTTSKFTLLDLTSRIIKINVPNSSTINFVNLNTIGQSVKFYLESYGYSTPTNTFNYAFTSNPDSNIVDIIEYCLNKQVVYDLLINKIVKENSCFPMSNSVTNSSTVSNGWYFDSSKNYNLKLLDDTNVNLTYSNLDTLFVEMLISADANIELECFNEKIKITGEGKKIIYFKNSPFATETTVAPPVNQMTAKTITKDNKYYQNIDAGIHSYAVTYYNQDGETTGSETLTTITILVGSGRVQLEKIPISPHLSVTGRKIYRTKANDTSGICYLVAVIPDNITTSIYDYTPDNLLGNQIPQTNTTNKSNNFPYFTYLDTNTTSGILVSGESLLGKTILPEKKVGEFLLNIGNQTDIELLSYGYKILGDKSNHFMTRWTSIESNAIVHNVDKFLTIQKDVINITEDSEVAHDSKFKVKAYGDFIHGSYTQNGNNYGDIRVNVGVNIPAIRNALFILDSADISNFTIKITGLKYRVNGVGITRSNGTVSSSIVPFVNKLKYIVPNYAASSQFLKNDFITLRNGQEIFYSNGGITSVLIQGVYAALFKEFNKSASILNNIILNSFGQVVLEVNKPSIPVISYDVTDAQNLIPGAIYSYKITYFTSIGETESSIPSSDIIQPYRQAKKIKVEITQSSDQRVIGRKIYRRNLGKNNDKYVYIGIVSNNTSTFFIDDVLEPVSLEVSPPSLAFLSNNLSNYTQINAALLLKDTTSDLTGSSNYKYAFSYYSIDNNQIKETELSEISNDTYIGSSPYKIILNLPISPSPLVNGRYIYRTKADSDTFYLLGTVPNNTSTIFVDSVSDINLSTKNPLVTSTLPGVTKPLLTFIGGYFFSRPQSEQLSLNFVPGGSYKYKFTYVVSSSQNDELGETAPSVETDSVIQPLNKAVKILVNVPISSDPTVIKRNIYRTEASGNIFKFVGSINDNRTSLFLDNVADNLLGRAVLSTNSTNISAPEVNTTVNSSGNVDPINNLISDVITEENIPVSSSKLFKLYVKSGRYAKDTSIYLNPQNTVQMTLENMEINIKCRLRGLLYDITRDSSTLKYPLTKSLAELIFGKFVSPSGGTGGEPETLVREVKRVGKTTIGIDDVGNQIDMLNNEINEDGSYKVTSEIQYIIDFTICLVQKTN